MLIAGCYVGRFESEETENWLVVFALRNLLMDKRAKQTNLRLKWSELAKGR
jgi:hypothetical protein